MDNHLVRQAEILLSNMRKTQRLGNQSAKKVAGHRNTNAQTETPPWRESKIAEWRLRDAYEIPDTESFLNILSLHEGNQESERSSGTSECFSSRLQDKIDYATIIWPRIQKACEEIRAEIQKQRSKKGMPSATEVTKSKGGGAGNLLKGSSIPMKKSSVVVKILEARPAPDGFNSDFILDIEPVYECPSFPLNRTNTRALIDLLGDDYSKWRGASVTLQVVMRNNPQTGKLTRGLAVQSATKGKKR